MEEEKQGWDWCLLSRESPMDLCCSIPGLVPYAPHGSDGTLGSGIADYAAVNFHCLLLGSQHKDLTVLAAGPCDAACLQSWGKKQENSWL